MTVQQQTPYNTYTGNGVTTVFPYQFKIRSATDLTVYVSGVLKILNADYTVSGVGLDTGGSVTFISGTPVAAAAISIVRAGRRERLTDYQLSGDFNTPTVNPDFDNPILLIQDLAVQLQRAITLPIDEVGTLPTLPSKANRVGKYIAFDANGLPVGSVGTGNDTALRTDLASGVPAIVDSVAVSIKRTPAETNGGAIVVNGNIAPGNILRYGGDPTGVASSDTAGQAMLNQRAQGGAPCYVPTGTYKQAVVWTYPLSLTPLRLYGDGMFSSVITTALDIENLNNAGADATHGLPDPYIHDISFYNTFPVAAGAGATHFHVHLQNPLNARVQRVYCKSNFQDADFNANNHAGVWLEQVAGYGAAFQNLISESWMQNGQVNVGTSDSAVTLCIIWGHPCDYAIKVDKGNIAVHDNYDLTGSRNHGAVWLTTNATQCRVTDNFFDGDNGAINSGYGVWGDLQNSNFIEDNIFWTTTKAAVWLVNPTVWTVSGNIFLNCGKEDINTDDSDIVLQATAFASNNIITNNQHFRTDARANAAYAVFEKNSGAAPQANRIALNSILDTAAQYQAVGILVATTLFNNGSVLSGNVGKSAATEVYSAPANALTLSGCTTAPTITPRITRQGNLVEIYVPAVNGLSNSTACKLSGVPAAFRPANTARGSCIVQSSGNAVAGFWAIDGTGDITLYVVVPATGIVNSAAFVNDNLAKGIIDGLTMVYPLT